MKHSTYSRFVRLLLEVEVSPQSASDFANKYGVLTGESARTSPYYQVQPNKWGLEARIYFDAPDVVVENLRMLGHHVELRDGGGYRADFAYRVNSEQLFWTLVRHGYRLGENVPI